MTRDADIAVVIESMGGGGAQQVASSLLAHWAAAGRRVDLITLRGPEVDAYPIPPQVRRVVVDGSGASKGLVEAIFANLSRIIALRSALRRSGAAAVVSFVSTTNILAILASRGLGQRIIISERNDPRRQPLPAVWSMLRRFTYPLADVVTANTMAAVHALSDMGIVPGAVYLPNPLRQSLSSAVAAKSGLTIIAVGRLHAQKAYDILLKAFAIVSAAVPDCRLRILGSGALEGELRALASQLAIPVDFLGHVDDPFPYYKAADLFVMASRYEGSPNALWEAMSCGLPAVITSSMEGAVEVVAGSNAVRIARSDDVNSLAQAILELASNPAHRETLATEARELVRCFEPTQVYEAWDRIVSGGQLKQSLN